MAKRQYSAAEGSSALSLAEKFGPAEAARLAQLFGALSAEEDRALVERLSRADSTEPDAAIRQRYRAIRQLEGDVDLLHRERRARVAGRRSVLDRHVVLIRLPCERRPSSKDCEPREQSPRFRGLNVL